ncbi:MAG: hypothetical protein J5647_14125 [Spirochaetaceae bacterium]|nr:hypothetical protein [Spirochaetaceae bacterium]
MTEDELHQLKRELYKWAKQNLRGQKVTNVDSGNIIEISAQGIGEWYSKSKSEEQIKSITLLTEILQSARLTHTSKNTHSERKNAPTFEYYECPIEIDEKGFNAVTSIKVVIENVGDRRIYYHHYLGDLKNQTALNSSAPTN